jgi:hypothetical protein
MNFTESFQEFSSRVSGTDLALYAGVGLVLWVLFKDKLSPVQKLVMDLVDKFKGVKSVTPTIPPVAFDNVASKINEDTFFKLVVSWKQTRDLAVQNGCAEAVKVADQMFPYLSPTICANKEGEVK